MVVIDCKPILSLVEITTRFFDWHGNMAVGIMGGDVASYTEIS